MNRPPTRISWLFVLIAHAVLAAAWWWLMPGGFPATHPRFWVNQILPLAMIAAVIATVLAARRGKLAVVRILLLALAAIWIGVGVAARIIFPISLDYMAAIPVIVGAIIAKVTFAPTLRPAKLPRVLTVIVCLLALPVGGVLTLAQRSPLPSTVPVTIALPPNPLPITEGPPPSASLRGFDVNPNTALLTIQRGRFVAHLRPMLTFTSRSPDRCWTNFSPPPLRMGPSRDLVGYHFENGQMLAKYGYDGPAYLAVTDTPKGAAEVEAITHLPDAIYSHLNTFTELQFAGHRNLTLAFSPCPDAKIEVTPFDYPFGRPAKIAYLDADRRFHVVEASSGEKGPFRTLAEGKLAGGDELAISFFDGEDIIARLTLRDFAAQCSTALSPTAGWRLPVNAIEFSRDGDHPHSTASVYVTLAGTSVGRGFDSVGHAAGAYRNRLKFEWVE